MAKVLFRVSLATETASYEEGEVAEIPDAWAAQLIKGGSVEKVDKTATLGVDRRRLESGSDRETAVQPRGENRKAR